MKIDFKNININFYILISLCMGIFCFILYFFPFFSYSSPSTVEDQYYYSGFEMTQAIFWDEEDLNIEDGKYQEKWLLIQLKNEESIKGAVVATSIFAMLGLATIVLTIILLLFEKGKKAEIISSIISTICFTFMVVLVRQICKELTSVIDIGYIEAGSTMSVVWGLYTILVFNCLFTCTNFLRHDKKVIAFEQKRKERQKLGA